MVPKIKKILYATDLSENARHAFGYAADLSQRYDAPLTILYVMENIKRNVEIQLEGMLRQEEWDRIKSENHDYLIQQIKSKIEDFCREMKKS